MYMRESEARSKMSSNENGTFPGATTAAHLMTHVKGLHAGELGTKYLRVLWILTAVLLLSRPAEGSFIPQPADCSDVLDEHLQTVLGVTNTLPRTVAEAGYAIGWSELLEWRGKWVHRAWSKYPLYFEEGLWYNGYHVTSSYAFTEELYRGGYFKVLSWVCYSDDRRPASARQCTSAYTSFKPRTYWYSASLYWCAK